MPSSLTGKTVLITGGSRGIGAECAVQAVAAGADVIIVDVRDDQGAEVASSLGDRCRYEHLDITSESDWARVLGTVDVLHGLVNNAAILSMGSIAETPNDVARQVLDVNVFGVFLGIKMATPVLAAAKSSSVVNISSIDGVGGMNSVAIYSASKWGVRGLTRSAAIELGRQGIRVNAVCPSMGSIEMSAPFMHRADINRYMASRPWPKLFDGDQPFEVGCPEVAAMVTFLLSDDSRGCTGADYMVDAGWTAGPYCDGLPGF